jgi:hypothetical protein
MLRFDVADVGERGIRRMKDGEWDHNRRGVIPLMKMESGIKSERGVCVADVLPEQRMFVW